MTRQFLYCSLMMAFCAFISCNNDAAQESKANESTANAQTTGTMKTIVFFGNSLTAGFGLDPSESFPSLIQQKIDSAGLAYKVINAGVSGETTSGGVTRIAWVLKQPMDVFVLELGANDGLRGIPVSETKRNLQTIIDLVKEQKPQAKIILAGMQVPPNMGEDYANDFKNAFVDLSTANNIPLIPFLLEGVGGIRELNLPDGIHPSAAGQKIVANNVWAVLQSELQ